MIWVILPTKKIEVLRVIKKHISKFNFKQKIMKKITKIFTLLLIIGMFFSACENSENQTQSANNNSGVEAIGGQSTVQDDESQKNIVQVAVASKDHTTLVAAVTAAEYADVLSNAGPFTVFAPTNAAFDALPKGTVENLVKPENKDALRNILEYHVFIGGLKEDNFQEGQTLGQANGDNATLTKKNGKWYVNGAQILGTANASNGIVYVVDAVLLPPDKK